MKALVIIASALFAFTASAGEFSKPASVTFQSASAWVPAAKVCRDGAFLKHKTKATIAVEYCKNEGSSGKGSNCYIVNKPLLQPVVSTAARCAVFTGKDDSGCAQWETYTLDQSKVTVWFYNSQKDMENGDRGWTNGTKYTIPACATGDGAAN
ncbi:hypothetical protein K2X05_04295 [bacterium]|nr:hypothetical protein [bacterium]